MASQLHRRAALAVAATVIVLACSGSEGPTAPPQTPGEPAVDTFSVEIVGPDSLRVNAIRAKYEAIVRDQTGAVRPGIGATWATDRPSVATPDSTFGWIDIHGIGDFTITVRAAGAVGRKTVSVTPLPIDTAYVTVDRMEVVVGATVGVPYMALDSVGAPGSVSADAVVEDSTVARHAGRNRIVGVREGTTRAFLSLGRFADTVWIDVVPVPVASIELDVGGVLPTGSTRQLSPVLKDPLGRVLTGRAVAWSVADTSIATIDDEGRVTGVQPGSTSVTAAAGTVSVTRTLRVDDRVGSIDIDVPALLRLGQTVPMIAHVRGPAGNPVSIEPEWSVTDSTVLSLESGRVVPLKVGWSTIRVSAGGLVATRLVEVRGALAELRIRGVPTTLELGASSHLVADGVEASGQLVPGVTAEWSAAPPPVLEVSGGRVFARVLGSATLTATHGSLSDTLAILVTPPFSARLYLVPSGTSLRVGHTVGFEWRAETSSGDSIPGMTPPVFSVVDTTIARHLGGGVFEGRSPGRTQVEALWPGGRVARGTLDVVADEIATRVVIDPIPALLPGDAVRPTARVENASGDALDIEPTWRVDDTNVAVLAADGRLIAQGVGTTTLHARAGAVSASVPVQVRETLERVDISAPPFVPRGDSVAISARAYGADGSEITDATIGWTVSPVSGSATVLPGARLRGDLVGEVRLRAAYGGVADTVTVTVTPPRGSTYRVIPDSIMIEQGRSFNLYAAVYGPDGNYIPRVEPVSISVDDPSVASRLSGSSYRAHRLGTTTVQMHFLDGSVAVSRVVVVQQTGRPERIEVEPAELNIAVGEQVRIEPVVYDVNGIPILTAQFTWGSANSEIATIDASYLVTGVYPGSTTITVRTFGMQVDVPVVVRGGTGPVGSVTLSPRELQLWPETSKRFKVTAADVNGDPLSVEDVEFTSLDPDVFRIDGEGRAAREEGFGMGRAVATLDGVSDTAQVRVGPTISRVEVDSILGIPGDRFRENLRVWTRTYGWENRYPFQDVLDLEFPEGLARLTEELNPRIELLAPGVGEIRWVSYDGEFSGVVGVRAEEPRWRDLLVVGTRHVTVGDSARFGMRGRTQFDPDTAHTRYIGNAEAWSSSDPQVASIDEDGWVRAHSPGSAVLTGAIADGSATFDLEVTGSPVVAITTIPRVALARPDEEVEFEVVAITQNGDTAAVPQNQVQWWNSDLPLVGTNRFRTRLPGFVYLNPHWNGHSARVGVATRPVPVASLSIVDGFQRPIDTLVVRQGERAYFQAEKRSKDGAYLGAETSYGGLDQGVVQRVSGGIVGRAPGTTRLEARSGRLRDIIVVRVIRPTVDRVEVEPSGARLAPGDELAATARVWNGYGTELSSSVSWVSSAPSVATVDQGGRVRVVGTGSAWIVAESNDVVDSLRVVVDAPGAGSVGQIEIVGGDQGVLLGQERVVEAITRSATGTPVPGRAPVWTSSDESIFRVDGAGRILGTGSGEATLTASLDGVQTSVTVVSGARMRPLEAPIRLLVGEEREIPIDARRMDGQLVPDPAYRIESRRGVARVLPSGRVIGDRPGTDVLTVRSGGVSILASVEVDHADAVDVFRFTAEAFEWPYLSDHFIGLTGYLEAWRWNGEEIPMSEVSWESTDPSVGTVDENGVFTRLRAGVVTIRATYGSHVAQIEVR